eukprot:3827054-Lingulodinium_polyedra.AAC.1
MWTHQIRPWANQPMMVSSVCRDVRSCTRRCAISHGGATESPSSRTAPERYPSPAHSSRKPQAAAAGRPSGSPGGAG